MAKLRDPLSFCQAFQIDPAILDRLGVFDPILNCDTPLFVDPLLMRYSRHDLFSINAVNLFERHFGDIITLLEASELEGDLPWREAKRRFVFHECPYTCIGYGGSTIHGRGIGEILGTNLLRTAKEIVDLGVKNPNLFTLLGLLDEGLGPDRISDMATTAILPVIAEFSETILAEIGIAGEPIRILCHTYQLARNPFEGENAPILLLPSDILRDLPVASSWDEISDAAAESSELRNRLNLEIGEIWKTRNREDKDNARRSLLSSRRVFESFLEKILDAPKDPYDPISDPEGHYLWRHVMETLPTSFPFAIRAPMEANAEELSRIVGEIIEQFQVLIEDNRLSELLWHQDKPRHERAAQRLFFGIATSYCKANNLDISPETDAGAGSVDFKFSRGYDSKILVELKMSTGQVVSGYKRQIEAYRAAEETDSAIFVILDVGNEDVLDKKLDDLLVHKNREARAGRTTTEFLVIDCVRRPSASNL